MCRRGPIQHGVEIRIGDREVIKQEFAVAELLIQILQSRFIFP